MKMPTIGADIEFVLSKDNNFLPVYNSGVRLSNEVGDDGSLMEIRPKYGNSPFDFMVKLGNTMRRAIKRFKSSGIEMHAGNYKFGCAIGGHIHIGNLPTEYVSVDSKRKILLTALNDLVGRPLRLASDLTLLRKRLTNSGYGRMYACNIQNSNRIEYRTPPSWPVNPIMSAAVIFTAYNTVLFVLENDRSPSKQELLDYWKTSHKRIGEIFMRAPKKLLKEASIDDVDVYSGWRSVI